MKSLKDYLIESTKEYDYRLKTVHSIKDEDVKSLEKMLSKYHLIDISKMKKTILQDTPLDFPNVKNKEVYIIDFKTSLPCSQYVLQQEIKTLWNTPEDFVVVRNLNEPKEIETDRLLADAEINQTAIEKKLAPNSKLSTDSEYPVEEQGVAGSTLYGNEYNSNFLTQLAKIQSERKENRVEPKAPLFSWLKYPEHPLEENGFNDGLSHTTNAAKSVPQNKIDAKKIPVAEIETMKNSYGALQNDPVVTKSFKDATALL